jgi:hypothetical protein
VDRASSNQPAPLHVKSPENESGPTLSSASSVPAVPPESRAITSAASEVSVSRPLQQVAATTLDGEVVKEAVSRVHLPEPERIITPALPEAAQQSASREALNTASPPTGGVGADTTGTEARSAVKKPQRTVETSQVMGDRRPNRSAVQPSSARETTTRRDSAPKRNGKPAAAQRSRVAAAQSAEPSTAPTPSPATEPVAEQRVHLLGIPLPTGRAVRECLLEWRC